MTRSLDVRPWNVKPGDRISIETFPMVGGRWTRRTITVQSVVKDRHFMSGESLWFYVYDLNTGDRTGSFYRDERVRIER